MAPSGWKGAIISAGGMLFAQGLRSPEALEGVGEELAAAVEAAEENPKGQEEENNEHSEKRTHLPLQGW